MTGGYHLLAPVALTVTLSYFIQVNLSSRLKYKSLYEAQVPFRAHSPAHHIEQLESVLSLISEKKFSVPASVTHLDLRNLIEAGVPVDLPDHGQLALLTLKPECEFINQPIFTAFPPNDRNDVNVIAIFRHGHMLLPQSSLKLRAVDQLLAIVSHNGKDSLSNNHTLKVKV
jgi:CIC family chloride channel protein